MAVAFGVGRNVHFVVVWSGATIFFANRLEPVEVVGLRHLFLFLNKIITIILIFYFLGKVI